MEIGYRESKDSRAEVLRSLRDRGLRQPLVFIGDGNLGLWAAQGEVYPEARRQRCWNHRLLNLKDKLPKRLQATTGSQIYEAYQAPTRQECESRRDALADWLRTENQPAAAETLSVVDPDHVLVVSDYWRRRLADDYGVQATVIVFYRGLGSGRVTAWEASRAQD